MSLLSWLPGTFKEMLGHVPTLLFDVVSWGALTKDITLLSKRMMSHDGAADARAYLTTMLPHGMEFCHFDPTLPQTPEAREMLGAKILSLYFKQLKTNGPMFLDLRPSGFGIGNNKLLWNPNSLWSRFSADFHHGVTELYAGFYLNDEKRFHSGLTKTGLIQEQWLQADKDHMAYLFRAHFAGALDTPMKFNLHEFQTSFQKIFAFLLEKKVKLTTDFLVLGIMLVTLYLSLQELGGEYAVAKIYHEAQS